MASLLVPDDMLQNALAYARMGWKVFPLHTIVDGHCSCNKTSCKSVAKHPRTARGFRDATTDPGQIRKWWARWPGANIGIATGDGLVVVDVDGEEGATELKAVVEANQPLPETLVARTGGGLHFVFAERPGAIGLRSAARNNVHVRGAGGYIVAPNSKHRSGRTYQWVKKVPIAELPDWLRQWLSGYEIVNKNPKTSVLGPLPDYLKNNIRNVSEIADNALKSIWSPAEQARLVSALSSIPADKHDSWVAVGMGLKDLNWQTNDSDIGFDLWVAWSETCPDKFSLGVCEARWNSFKRSGVSIGSVYHLAKEHGWNGGLASIGTPSATPGWGPGMNGHATLDALPAAFLAASQAIFFPDRDDEGRPKSTCTNAGVAVRALAIRCRKDLFHEKMLVAGEPINAWAGDMSDDVIQMIRKTIRYRFGFDPKVENTRDACTQLCLENQFDPVCDYLDGLQWDGAHRLETWLAHYMGAPDTELNRVIGRLTLIAAVRRAFAPGTKFDQIVVLEGTEGRGKSTAIEILAGKENFSDQKILGLSDKEQQEAMCGVWLYEIAELTGMRRAETEHVKAFASRTVDRARPAYGRFRVDRPRRAICFATTNDDEYLKSETGNRRFWPVVTGHIELEALRRDRDQLWAEAAELEARAVSIVLPEKLWKAASAEQTQRLEMDVWLEPISNYLNLKNLAEVSVMQVLVDNQFLQLQAGHIGRGEQMRATTILKRLGYEKQKRRDGNRWSRKAGG